MKKLILTLCLLGGLSSAFAASPQQFTFALPELDGRISLGVFNSSSQLVRTLFVQATTADFTIGINGLITTWDGKNDAGQDQPSGKYFVRGYVVGDQIKSEGIDFHFNDWVDSEDSPPLQSPRLIYASGDNLFLLGLNDLFYCFSERDGLHNLCTVQAESFPEGIFRFHTSEKSLVEVPLADGPVCAIWQEKSYVAPAYGSPIHGLTVSTLASPPDPKEMENSPSGISLLDANRAALVASDRQHVWIYRGKSFDQVPFAEDLSIHSLSAGLGDTFWVVGQTTTAGIKGPPFVRQYSFLGELLRQLACDTDSTTLYADKELERIFLTQSPDSATTKIQGLRPLPFVGPAPANGPKVVNWEIFMEKISTLCPQFGLADGRLVADAGSKPQPDTYKIKLADSTLQGTPQTLTIQMKATGKEIWMQTNDGLHLMPVGVLEGGNRCVVASSDQPGTLKVYAGNGAVVAEYRLSSLDQIAEIDAGEIDLP